MKILCEKALHTDNYAGTADLITGIDDFDSELEFNEEFHTYKLNGKLLISVTQLLDDGTYDNKNIDKDVLKYAQEKGTIVHKEIQEWLESKKDGFTKELDNFKELYKNNKKLFNSKAIFDFKTYSVATPKNREKCYKQIKMYDDALLFMTGKRVNHYYLVHLPHDKPGKIYDLKGEFENDRKS